MEIRFRLELELEWGGLDWCFCKNYINFRTILCQSRETDSFRLTFSSWQNRRGLTFSLSSTNLIIVSFSLLMWLIPTLSLIISSFLWHHHCTNGQENYFILGLLSNHHSLKEKTRNQSCNLIFPGAWSSNSYIICK